MKLEDQKKDGGTISFKDAYDVMAKTLSEDQGLYYAYQSNIAMQFQDVMRGAGYQLPDLHRIANQAAIQFLDLFIGKSVEEQLHERKNK